MAISIEFAEDAELQARIKVIGVGGGGGNAVNTMIQAGLEGVEFIAANTDVQALRPNLAPKKIQLGSALTKGLGAGANPRSAARPRSRTSSASPRRSQGADMVFVTAGMGGGTGTGAAPIIAQIARDSGALTVAVVTKPFSFEGRRRCASRARASRSSPRRSTRSSRSRTRSCSTWPSDDMSMLEAFRSADEVLLQAVQRHQRPDRPHRHRSTSTSPT